MSSGAARASNRANGYPDDRPRVSGHNSFKTERSDSRKGPSPQPGSGAGASAGAHKRSASGNPRPTSRTTNERERRFEERRVTERTFEAQLERLVPRGTTEAAPSRGADKRPAEVPRHKTPEVRPKETRAETPQGMMIALDRG